MMAPSLPDMGEGKTPPNQPTTALSATQSDCWLRSKQDVLFTTVQVMVLEFHPSIYDAMA